MRPVVAEFDDFAIRRANGRINILDWFNLKRVAAACNKRIVRVTLLEGFGRRSLKMSFVEVPVRSADALQIGLAFGLQLRQVAALPNDLRRL